MNNLLLRIYRKVSRFFLRRRLANRNVTILTDTCIAGVIYHELGLQFLSPTINLFFEDTDFYKFIRNLKEYLSMELRFVKGVANYPTAYLGDILIHFNHYHTEEEAAAKWYERCKRINWDNIYVICSDRPINGNVVTYEDIKCLDSLPYVKAKVIFSVQHYDDIDYILPLPKDDTQDCVKGYMMDKTWLGTWRWEKYFDYVYWLNTGKLKKYI